MGEKYSSVCVTREMDQSFRSAVPKKLKHGLKQKWKDWLCILTCVVQPSGMRDASGSFDSREYVKGISQKTVNRTILRIATFTKQMMTEKKVMKIYCFYCAFVLVEKKCMIRCKYVSSV